MYRKLFITAAAMLTMLVMPSLANAAACNKGITNGVTVASPSKLTGGETQGQHYMITACTTVARVTVEWVRIVNSGQSWLAHPANRVSLTGEIGQGTSMQGATSYTMPLDATPGHYAVITRYYAAGSNAPEDVAGSSFIVKAPVDLCPSMGGIQQTQPVGHSPAPDCRPDVCPTITGIQPDAPTGTVAPTCLPDVCPTLDGIQTSPPTGTVAPACVVPPVVIVPTCPNIPTMTLAQAAGAGLTIDAAGNCVETVIPTGVVGTPKLSITKVGNRRTVKQGGIVKFTVKVRNTGTADALRVRVCDFMPSGMVYVANTGTAYFSAGRLCWNIAKVAKGKTVNVGIVTVRIVKSSGRIVNVACIMRAATGSGKTKCAKAPVKITGRKPEPTGGVTG